MFSYLIKFIMLSDFIDWFIIYKYQNDLEYLPKKKMLLNTYNNVHFPRNSFSSYIYILKGKF